MAENNGDFFIDRIEGDQAVLTYENGEGKTVEKVVPLSDMPRGTREGATVSGDLQEITGTSEDMMKAMQEARQKTNPQPMGDMSLEDLPPKVDPREQKAEGDTSEQEPDSDGGDGGDLDNKYNNGDGDWQASQGLAAARFQALAQQRAGALEHSNGQGSFGPTTEPFKFNDKERELTILSNRRSQAVRASQQAMQAAKEKPDEEASGSR